MKITWSCNVTFYELMSHPSINTALLGRTYSPNMNRLTHKQEIALEPIRDQATYKTPHLWEHSNRFFGVMTGRGL